MVVANPVSLVLLPGLDGTGLLFQPLVDALPAGIKPIVVRYPGDRQLSYQELLPLVLNALPRTGPFVILGESFSGPLAAMAAATRPPGLAGLILCATFVTPPWPILRPAVPVLARPPLFWLYPLYKRIKARVFGYSTPRHRQLMAEMDQLMRPHVIAARVRMVFQVDARETLRSCDIPMLYIKASRDILVPSRNLRVIQQINPEIQVVTIASSHMVLQRHPVEAAGAILTFVSSLRTADD